MHFSVIAVHCSVLSNTDSQLIVPKSWTCVSSLMHPEASVTVTRDSTTYRTKHATTGNTTLTSSAQSQIPSISDWRRRESDLLSSPVSHTLRGTLPRKYYTVHVSKKALCMQQMPTCMSILLFTHNYDYSYACLHTCAYYRHGTTHVNDLITYICMNAFLVALRCELICICAQVRTLAEQDILYM